LRFSALSSEALIIERGDAAVLAAARADTALRCTLLALLACWSTCSRAV
jgi:hypothetical protein